jgi:N6-adenosine-specific RNA methylase IME4
MPWFLANDSGPLSRHPVFDESAPSVLPITRLARGSRVEKARFAVSATASETVVADFRAALAGARFGAILADPPWQFTNRTGKVAPEHRRLRRYMTLTLDEIAALPVHETAAPVAHLYLWVPNALLAEGLRVMQAWGFAYKSNLVWHKVQKDLKSSDGRGVGFYFRNVTELVLFGVRGKNARTLAPGRRQVNLLATRKREHSRKPDELYGIVEACSPGPYLELFARGERPGWSQWGDQAGQPSNAPATDAPAINPSSSRGSAKELQGSVPLSDQPRSEPRPARSR